MIPARSATTIAFILNGAGMGSLVSRLPDYKAGLNINNGTLGTALFFSALGVLIALGPAGRCCAKYGSAPVLYWSSVGFAFTFPILGLARNYLSFCIALFLFGFGLATQDVSMNTHASTLEHKTEKRMMSVFHAMFSLGGLLGGAIGGALSQFKVSTLTQNLSLGLIVLICGLGIHSSLLPAAADKHEYLHGKRMRKPLLFWGLGLLGVCATISEGTAGDWGGILARETFHASYFLSTVPFIAFSATMVIGRFSGDLLAEKYGAARLLIAGGILAGTGLSAGLLIGSIYSQIAGWFALGLGISVIIPLIYSAAGSIARNKYDGIIAPSEAVALVSGIAYFSFIAGPPTIGFLSELISLRWALLLPALLAFALSIGSRFAMAD